MSVQSEYGEYFDYRYNIIKEHIEDTGYLSVSPNLTDLLDLEDVTSETLKEFSNYLHTRLQEDYNVLTTDFSLLKEKFKENGLDDSLISDFGIYASSKTWEKYDDIYKFCIDNELFSDELIDNLKTVMPNYFEKQPFEKTGRYGDFEINGDNFKISFDFEIDDFNLNLNPNRWDFLIAYNIRCYNNTDNDTDIDLSKVLTCSRLVEFTIPEVSDLDRDFVLNFDPIIKNITGEMLDFAKQNIDIKELDNDFSEVLKSAFKMDEHLHKEILKTSDAPNINVSVENVRNSIYTSELYDTCLTDLSVAKFEAVGKKLVEKDTLVSSVYLDTKVNPKSDDFTTCSFDFKDNKFYSNIYSFKDDTIDATWSREDRKTSLNIYDVDYFKFSASKCDIYDTELYEITNDKFYSYVDMSKIDEIDETNNYFKQINKFIDLSASQEVANSFKEMLNNTKNSIDLILDNNYNKEVNKTVEMEL